MTTSENKQARLRQLAGAAGDFVRNRRTVAEIEVFVISASDICYSPFCDRAKFWCKTAQLCATHCEKRNDELHSISNCMQSSETLGNSLGLNHESML